LGKRFLHRSAIVTAILILILSVNADVGEIQIKEYNLWQIVPYLLVLIGGICGLNVFVTLLVGIVTGSGITLATGAATVQGLIEGMGSGAKGMFETAMVAILVSALCALVRHNGGFDALLYAIRRVFRGKQLGQLGIGLLVAMMDVATANNTVAIVVANPIATEMAKDYHVTPQKTASLLDTFSCIAQGFLPYGAQILVALSAVSTMGYEITAFDIIGNLFYPMLLLLSYLVFIFLIPERKGKADGTK